LIVIGPSCASRPTSREETLERGATKDVGLGDSTALDGIVRGVPMRYLATHPQGDAIILTFASQTGTCVDLVARRDANVVRSREC
jgi:hypothetical protein